MTADRDVNLSSGNFPDSGLGKFGFWPLQGNHDPKRPTRASVDTSLGGGGVRSFVVSDTEI